MNIDPAPDRIPGRPDGASFEVISASDDLAWLAVLSQVTRHDVYHLASYHRLAEYHGEGVALLFVYRDGGYVIAVPLLVRPVDESDSHGLQDATSVYGYAGPIASHDHVPPRIVSAFHEHLREEIERRRVVAVFSRLHPLIEQDHLLEGLGATVQSSLTVSVDLTRSQDEQWSGYSKGLRRLIRRGLEAGVVCTHDPDLVHLHEFAAIYRETMQRVGAPDSYRFDAAYFDRMAAEIGPALHLFMAFVDGGAVAGGLFTTCDGIVEAHLGGSRDGFSAYSPVRVIDDSARRWAAESGAWAFHLGGGVGGRQDSLFEYKARFSRERLAFATWQWIVDDGAYERLSRQRLMTLEGEGGTSGADHYFPAYREPGASPARSPRGDHHGA